MGTPVSTYIREFEASVMPDFNAKPQIHKKVFPKLHKYAEWVMKGHNTAMGSLTSWAEKIKSADKPHEFKNITAQEKENLEKKSSLHKTIAKVVLIIGVLLTIIGFAGPWILLPLYLSWGPEVAGLATWCFTAVSAIGMGLVLSTIWINNTEAIRQHTVHTDPDFTFFIDRIVQHEKGPDEKNIKGLGLKLPEENLIDKELHKAFFDWKEFMLGVGRDNKVLFSQEKRDKLNKIKPIFS